MTICAVTRDPELLLGLQRGRAPSEDSCHVAGHRPVRVAYTLLDCIVLQRVFLANPQLKRAALIGIGIRLVLSVIVPLGMLADLLPGLLSLTLVRQSGTCRRAPS